MFSIEKYIQKAQNKLAAMYLIDSICRASLKNPSLAVYIKRVSEKLPGMMVFFMQSSDKDKEKMKRLLALWRDNSVIPAAVIDSVTSSFFGNHTADLDVSASTSIGPPSSTTQTLPLPPASVGSPPKDNSHVISGQTPSINNAAKSAIDLSETPIGLPSFSPGSFSAMSPTVVGVGSLLSSVLHGGSTTQAPTLDHLNTILNIQAPPPPTVTRDPSNFDYDDEEDILFVPSSKSNVPDHNFDPHNMHKTATDKSAGEKRVIDSDSAIHSPKKHARKN